MGAEHSISLGPPETEPPSYPAALRALNADGVPYLVGGAIALGAYAGIRRDTKDLDLFTLPEDVKRVLDVLERAGLRTELPFPHWLGKAHCDDEHFVDVIFNAGNGAAPVDSEWFAHAHPAVVMGVPVAVCPPEETLWSKAFVMERERFDGADVAHLLLSCAETLDWMRLLRRFADNWRVLYAHLVLFGFVYPDESRRIPGWVLRELNERLENDASRERPREHVCQGTLLSREQYLPDLERGWGDARLPPTGSMSRETIAIWTGAISKR
ncbi:MAG TPA: nucleotidyltransferase family protein [Polyangiaceae bacterium]